MSLIILRRVNRIISNLCLSNRENLRIEIVQNRDEWRLYKYHTGSSQTSLEKNIEEEYIIRVRFGDKYEQVR